LACLGFAWSLNHFQSARQIELQQRSQEVAAKIKDTQESIEKVQNDNSGQNAANSAIRDEDKVFLRNLYSKRKNTALNVINGVAGLYIDDLAGIKAEMGQIANERRSTALHYLIGGGITLLMSVFLWLLANIKFLPVGMREPTKKTDDAVAYQTKHCKCGGGVEFPSYAKGTTIHCPHCGTSLEL
jgi:hypothetical protein